ncbi:MAG TPA: hypothetical protein V6C85_13120 [Allocoleopsis sp.]
MSTRKASQFVLGLLALTSIAALPPAAHAQIAKPSTTVDNILNRANLSTDSSKLQPSTQQLSPSLERLNDPSKLRDDQNGVCNGSCSKPIDKSDLLTNPATLPATQLNQSLPQLRQ